MFRAGHEVVQLADGWLVHRGGCLRCAAARADRAAQRAAGVRREAMSGERGRVFECEGHEFVQLGPWPPEHADGTCRGCRARTAGRLRQPSLDRPRRFLCEGHVFDDMGGDFVLHRADCPACQSLHEAERARSRQIAEASKLSPEAEWIANVAYRLVGVGFVALVVWVLVTDPAGFVGAVVGMLMTPIANLMCVLTSFDCY